MSFDASHLGTYLLVPLDQA